ncbi:MAG TPA: DUF2905 domain-containing protein [Nitrospiria bacterium]|nr:DUF2905 domain-containing protein [Nitrospiria bacterium]
MQDLGRLLVVFGILLVAVGGILMATGKSPSWLGRLPGDIVIQRRNFSFYFPLATSLIISIVLSLLLWLFSRR